MQQMNLETLLCLRVLVERWWAAGRKASWAHALHSTYADGGKLRVEIVFFDASGAELLRCECETSRPVWWFTSPETEEQLMSPLHPRAVERYPWLEGILPPGGIQAPAWGQLLAPWVRLQEMVDGAGRLVWAGGVNHLGMRELHVIGRGLSERWARDPLNVSELHGELKVLLRNPPKGDPLWYDSPQATAHALDPQVVLFALMGLKMVAPHLARDLFIEWSLGDSVGRGLYLDTARSILECTWPDLPCACGGGWRRSVVQGAQRWRCDTCSFERMHVPPPDFRWHAPPKHASECEAVEARLAELEAEQRQLSKRAHQLRGSMTPHWRS